jgi:toxin ParE1/3/4
MVAVIYASRARVDLRDAWDYVAEENPFAADQLLDAIKSDVQMLATQPLMGRKRPELGSGVRSWPTSTPYILFYLVKGDEITVLRVLHHARDIQHAMTNPDL